MENEAPNIITWIGYVLPGVSLLVICGAIWWWGKLSGRVERLEADVASLGLPRRGCLKCVIIRGRLHVYLR